MAKSVITEINALYLFMKALFSEFRSQHITYYSLPSLHLCCASSWSCVSALNSWTQNCRKSQILRRPKVSRLKNEFQAMCRKIPKISPSKYKPPPGACTGKLPSNTKQNKAKTLNFFPTIRQAQSILKRKFPSVGKPLKKEAPQKGSLINISPEAYFRNFTVCNNGNYGQLHSTL